MMVSWYRRRKRLEFCHNFQNGSGLKRYKDPKTGKVYAGKFRYDPFMVRSVVDRLGIDVRAE